MTEICFSSVSKIYRPGLFKKNIQAVHDLSLEVYPGDVFGLIGPNGAGKSTSIRMLLGLIRPDAGTIRFRGKPLGEKSMQREVGYLPENPYLYDYLTLHELLTFCGKTSGLSGHQTRVRSNELISKLNLQDALRRPLKTFSKGMLQRAGICFALLHDPSIVILDEPMSGLDPIGRKMVFDLVMELKDQGKTIFFCSHILNDVGRLCDRIGLMNKGHLIREFDREDFLQNVDNAVYLHTDELTPLQLDHVRLLGGKIRIEAGGHLVAIPGDQYYVISSFFEESKVKILGCRSEWMSLEDLFMRTFREQR